MMSSERTQTIIIFAWRKTGHLLVCTAFTVNNLVVSVALTCISFLLTLQMISGLWLDELK